jgi:hypothetical protein
MVGKKEGEVTPIKETLVGFPAGAVLLDGKMGKILAWWENSGMVGLGKRPEKFPHGETKRLPVHENYSIAASWYCPGFTYPFCISALSGVHSILKVGVHAQPLSLYLPLHTTLWCMLRLRGPIHSPYFSSIPKYTLWVKRTLILVQEAHNFDEEDIIPIFCSQGFSEKLHFLQTYIQFLFLLWRITDRCSLFMKHLAFLFSSFIFNSESIVI